jgi:cell division protein FtsL
MKEQIFGGLKNQDYTAELEPLEVLQQTLRGEKSEKRYAEPMSEPAESIDETTIEELPVEVEKPKKKFRQQAHEGIESILNLRTFVVVAGTTILLALYIYNVISINRVAGEVESLKASIEEAKSLNIELESNLKVLQQTERIGREAYDKLGLKFSAEQPIEIAR